MKYKGYKGQLLAVDLSSGKIERRGLDEAILEKYLGGRGLAARLLYDEILQFG
jgi:aldehyde:ferredoxin oxidoreductase